MRFFGAQLSGGGAKLVFLKNKNGQKRVSENKKLCTYFLGQLRFISLLLDDVTRCFSRVCKKPYKNRFFLHTLLLDAEETEKRRKKKRKAKKKGYTQKMGGLQNGQEVVPPFFSKKTGFSKFSKTPIFIAFPEKMGGHHFF